MSWLLRHNWIWSLLAFALGAIITWILLDRRPPAPAEPLEDPAEEKEELLVGATIAHVAPTIRRADPAPAVPRANPAPAVQPVVRRADPEPAVRPAPVVRPEPEPVFSQLMDPEPTLFDHINSQEPEVPPGRYGEGSADAVPHQGPPDGFTIKGNAQSMLFHTPDSPYYGRTKPQVWFRTESDAERAGFTKYTRRPRKSPNPGD